MCVDWASQVALVAKNLPASVEEIRNVGGSLSPEEDLATHSSILAWKIPWTEEPSGLQSMGSQKSRT